MTLIIDGYNLLHASGVFGADRGPRGFEQSRRALLDVLVDLLGDAAPDTIVVFDAARAPDGLPARHVHGGIRVWFAREYPDADSLIEELVAADTAPGHLVVVSSDRRLQAAARRRRARAVDSDEWLAEARAARRAREAGPEKPGVPGAEDVEYWKRYFGL
ncbi:MAG: NYN domain-containing protein [Planctomycetaceae bacterium]